MNVHPNHVLAVQRVSMVSVASLASVQKVDADPDVKFVSLPIFKALLPSSSKPFSFLTKIELYFYFSVLSDPSSVCFNTTSLSPYRAIDAGKQTERIDDEHSCNSCICSNGKAKCSNIWCGLKNCLATNVTNVCASHEVCVPALHESCLYPPCEPRGDCRILERSRRVAPPKLPAPVECWPNQAILDEQCARITILMENKAIQPSTSVEGICVNLRTLLGTRLVKIIQDATPPQLILLCDIKTGTNDTIEVTVVSC